MPQDTAPDGATLVVPLDALDALGSALSGITAECRTLAADVTRLALDGSLLSSWSSSSTTAAAAVTALHDAKHHVSVLGTTSWLLGLGTRVAHVAYTDADAALGDSAREVERSLGHRAVDLLRGAVPFAQAAGDGLRTVASATAAAAAARSIATTLTPFVGAGAVVTYYQNLWQSYRSVLADPFSASSYAEARDAWDDVGTDFARNTLSATTAMPDPVYGTVLRGLPFVLSGMGVRDRARLTTASVVAPEELGRRAAAYRTSNPQVSTRTTEQPEDAADLAYTMGYVDALGSKDQAVIRVIRKDGPPPAFTVVIPSTKDWSLAAKVPNDLTGNLNIMSGDSALLRAADEALRRAMSAAGVDDPSTAKVMVAGFSQGGITAAAFAVTHRHDYDVRQVVTIGAPIGRFKDLPAHTRVLAYEFTDDVVPDVDHVRNPGRPGWETIRVPGGRHSAALYGDAAKDHPPQRRNHLDEFLGSGSTGVTDYYAVRAR